MSENGISVVISTWNNLEYLKASVESLKKHSRLDNEICVYVDGSTDGTVEWIREQPDVKYIYNSKHMGSITGRNAACRLATRDYVFLSEDGFIYSPGWDVTLMKWNEELGDECLLCPQLVEPKRSSFLIHNCGEDLGAFNEERFLDYAKSVSRHEVTYDSSFGLFVIRRDLYWAVGGSDTHFDPISFATLDLKLRLKTLLPDMKVARVHDSLIYHFPSRSWDHLRGDPDWNDMLRENAEYFYRKWGLGTTTLNKAYELLLIDGWTPTKGKISEDYKRLVKT